MKLLRTFAALARPFWCSRAGWPGWALLAGVFALGLGIVQVNVYVNEWSKTFYDTLASFDGDALLRLMDQYALAIGVLIGVVVSKNWLTKALILRWRQHLNEHLIERWLGERNYYRLSLGQEPDHPDQRIAEDVRLLAEHSVGLLVSLFINSAQIGAFVSILWNLSGTQTFELAGYRVTLDGYLVWAALLYTLIGTLITHLLGRPLHALNYERQRHEAAFRSDLLRKREHAEQIALYAGEAVERQGLALRFGRIAANWRALMARELKMGLFTTGYDRVSRIVPVFVALPAFLAKTLSLGGLMQVRTAFGAVQGSLSWFIISYSLLSEWSATVQRLGQFQRALQHDTPLPAASRRGANFATRQLEILRPCGGSLLSELDLQARRGEWLLLAGTSGLGKSTLLRTLGGLWPHYRGDWQLPEGRCLLLPQRPYLAPGRLAEVLAYPAQQIPPQNRLRAALDAVGLARLGASLQREAEWSRELSAGEQQRLSLARVLLWRPDCLFLDEATSALDEDAARSLLAALRERLPDCTVIGVSHQPGVQTLFDRRVALSATPACQAQPSCGELSG